MKQDKTAEVLEYLKRIDESINGPRRQEERAKDGRSLSDRVSEVQLGLATLAATTKAGFDSVDKRFAEVDKRFAEVDKRFAEVDKRFDRVDKRFDEVDKRFNEVAKRFDAVDRSIESTRVEIVDLVTRVHSELTGRVIDLEVPQPGGQGSGGSGSGGSGVPLAS